MKEGLSARHGRELVADSLEQRHDGRVVADERRGHFQTSDGRRSNVFGFKTGKHENRESR